MSPAGLSEALLPGPWSLWEGLPGGGGQGPQGGPPARAEEAALKRGRRDPTRGGLSGGAAHAEDQSKLPLDYAVS